MPEKNGLKSELSCGAMCFSSSAILTSGFRMYKKTCLVAARGMMNLCPIVLHACVHLR